MSSITFKDITPFNCLFILFQDTKKLLTKILFLVLSVLVKIIDLLNNRFELFLLRSELVSSALENCEIDHLLSFFALFIFGLLLFSLDLILELFECFILAFLFLFVFEVWNFYNVHLFTS